MELDESSRIYSKSFSISAVKQMNPIHRISADRSNAGNAIVSEPAFHPFKSDLMTVANKLFQQLREIGKFTDEIAVQLEFLFDQSFVAALDLLDRDLVTKINAQPSGRSFFQVESQSKSSEANYNCIQNFCSCYSFNILINKEESIMCKHQLAVKLAEALGKNKTKDITDSEYATLLCKVEDPKKVSSLFNFGE